MKIQHRKHRAFDFAAVLAALLSVPSVCAAQHSAPHGEAAFDRNMMASMEQMDQAMIAARHHKSDRNQKCVSPEYFARMWQRRPAKSHAPKANSIKICN